MHEEEQPRSDSIDDALRADHERLDALLLRLEAAVHRGSAGAAEELDRFVRALTHHMAWEDERLFPALRAVAGAKEVRSIESLDGPHPPPMDGNAPERS